MSYFPVRASIPQYRPHRRHGMRGVILGRRTTSTTSSRAVSLLRVGTFGRPLQSALEPPRWIVTTTTHFSSTPSASSGSRSITTEGLVQGGWKLTAFLAVGGILRRLRPPWEESTSSCTTPTSTTPMNHSLPTMQTRTSKRRRKINPQFNSSIIPPFPLLDNHKYLKIM